MAKTTNKFATKKIMNITVDAEKTIEDGAQKMTKDIENVTTFGQENVEAVAMSSKIVSNAVETIGAEVAAFSKNAYEESMAEAKDLTACTSVSEFFERQTAFSKTSIEGFVTEVAKLNETYAAAAKDAFPPLNARLTTAAGVFTETAKEVRV